MIVRLNLGNQKVCITDGELTGYEVADHEYIHQKGNPGWRNSDTEMFPIIGPTSEADFKVRTPKGEAVLDQHGLLREIPYGPISQNGTSAVFRKAYKAGAPVPNSKYPEKSTARSLSWPYDFLFEKSFELTEKGLGITFEISGERGTPFMLGYHPAFALYSKDPMVIANDRTITLNEVLEVGNRAFQIPDCQEIVLKDEKTLQIKTEGFGHFMLWTEVRNMICIEPITFYPYTVEQRDLHKGFQHISDVPKTFRVSLSVLGQ